MSVLYVRFSTYKPVFTNGQYLDDVLHVHSYKQACRNKDQTAITLVSQEFSEINLSKEKMCFESHH